MSHGVKLLTIAKTPTSKKCVNKLALKKPSQTCEDETDCTTPTSNDGFRKAFVETPPFFTKRRKDLSPLILFTDESATDTSTEKSNVHEKLNENSHNLTRSPLTEHQKADPESKVNDRRYSLNNSTNSTMETPKNSESIPSDITPDTINIMDELYGKVWRSTPGLFKNKKRKEAMAGKDEVEAENKPKAEDLSLKFRLMNLTDVSNHEVVKPAEETEDLILKSISNEIDDGDDSIRRESNDDIDSIPILNDIEPISNKLDDEFIPKPILTITDKITNEIEKVKISENFKDSNNSLLKDVINKDFKRKLFTSSTRKLIEENIVTTNEKSNTIDDHLKPCKLNFEDKKSYKEDKENKKPPMRTKKTEKSTTKTMGVEQENAKTYSFMASLADNVPSWRRDPRAKQYVENFKSKKDELAAILFKMFNENVFDSQIYSTLPIFWGTKLQTTAGRAHNKMVKVMDPRYGDGVGRRSRVELSSKVVDTAQRLRDTLAHELCHVASWLIDGQLRDGHGKTWKKWTSKVLRRYPEIGSLPVRHNLDIHFKYSYKCVKCGYKINRHSKSIDVERKRCGYCYGKFECVQNKKLKDGIVISTPVSCRKEVKGFALYVKENYGNVRSGNTPHKQAMKFLGQKYAEMKQGSNKEE